MIFNPLQDKLPYGASAVGTTNMFRFRLPSDWRVKRVFIVLRLDAKVERHTLERSTSKGGEDIFEGSFVLSSFGIWHYRFEGVLPDDTLAFFGSDDTGNALRGDWLPEWQLTVSKRMYKTPSWAKRGVVYHIFADRFAGVDVSTKWAQTHHAGTLHASWDDLPDIEVEGTDYRADDFFGGNAEGVRAKLPYLKSLGVTCLYLSPVFESSSNHRYDTADYSKIDSLFGTEDEFKRLVDEAKLNGINVVLDGVFNHTGADSVYFNKFGNYPTLGAYQSEDSPYRSWYYFNTASDDYHCWWGSTVVPTVNKSAQGFRDLIAGPNGVVQKWQSLGVKGWRLDVVDELPTDFVDFLCGSIKSADSDALIIGEVWEDASTKVSYSTWRPYFMGGELDGVMNYPFRSAILRFALDGDAHAFEKAVFSILNNYPKESLDVLFNNLGTHDTVRALTALSGVTAPTTKSERREFRLDKHTYALARRRLCFASALQYVLPGMPCVYYGDEAGVQGFEDPLNRGTYPWGKEDKSLLAHYRALGQMRTDLSAYFTGETHFISAENSVVRFERASGEGTLQVFANAGESVAEYPLSDSWRDATSGRDCGSLLSVEPLGVKVIYKRAN